MELFTLAAFALALNLDSFAAGIAYGARKIQVPPLSLLIISLISMAAISVSMLAGKILIPYLPPEAAHRTGGLLLLCIGLWVLLQSRKAGHFPPAEKAVPEEDAEPKIMEIRIRPMGLVVQILREPARADLDQSGIITPGEAIFLGLALAMDAFAAGFAVSMLGFSIGATALVVGTGHFCLAYAGITAGRLFAACRIGRHLAALPGWLLILLGLVKIR